MTRSDMNSGSTNSVVVPLAAFVVESAAYAGLLSVAAALVRRLCDRMLRLLAAQSLCFLALVPHARTRPPCHDIQEIIDRT